MCQHTLACNSGHPAVLQWFILLVFTTLALCASCYNSKTYVKQLGNVGLKPKMYLSSTKDMGIMCCQLQGNLKKSKKYTKLEHVVLRLYFRPLVHDTTLHLRGFLFAQSTDKVETYWGHIEQASSFSGWHGSLWLRSACGTDQENATRLSVYHAARRGHWAHHVEARASLTPEQLSCLSFTITADEFEGNCTLSSQLVQQSSITFMQQYTHSLKRKQRGLPKTGVFVLPNIYGLPSNQLAMLLWHHMEWHQQFDFETHVVYEEPAIIEALAAEPVLKDPILSGRLVLIAWDEVDPNREKTLELAEKIPLRRVAYLKNDQPIRCNHGMLFAWGRNAYVAQADMDEYLATPRRMTLSEVFETCGGRGALQICPTRRNIFNEGPLCAANEPEWTLWQQQVSPLLQDEFYEELAERKSTPKTILDNDKVPLHYGVHHNAAPHLDRFPDEECVRWLHLRYLLRPRLPEDKNCTLASKSRHLADNIVWPAKVHYEKEKQEKTSQVEVVDVVEHAKAQPQNKNSKRALHSL